MIGAEERRGERGEEREEGRWRRERREERAGRGMREGKIKGSSGINTYRSDVWRGKSGTHQSSPA